METVCHLSSRLTLFCTWLENWSLAQMGSSRFIGHLLENLILWKSATRTMCKSAIGLLHPGNFFRAKANYFIFISKFTQIVFSCDSNPVLSQHLYVCKSYISLVLFLYFFVWHCLTDLNYVILDWSISRLVIYTILYLYHHLGGLVRHLSLFLFLCPLLIWLYFWRYY